MLRKKGLSTLTGSYLLPEVALPRFRLTPEIHMYKNAGLGHIPLICSWSGLRIAHPEFSILLQMKLPSPQSQETSLSCHSVLLLLCHRILDRVHSPSHSQTLTPNGCQPVLSILLQLSILGLGPVFPYFEPFFWLQRIWKQKFWGRLWL